MEEDELVATAPSLQSPSRDGGGEPRDPGWVFSSSGKSGEDTRPAFARRRRGQGTAGDRVRETLRKSLDAVNTLLRGSFRAVWIGRQC